MLTWMHQFPFQHIALATEAETTDMSTEPDVDIVVLLCGILYLAIYVFRFHFPFRHVCLLTRLEI